MRHRCVEDEDEGDGGGHEASIAIVATFS